MECQASREEIKVTSEMIEAGIDELAAMEEGQSLSELAERVYLAMRVAFVSRNQPDRPKA